MKSPLPSIKALSILAFIFAGIAVSSEHNSQTEDPDPFIQEVHPTTGYNVTLEYVNTSGGYHWYEVTPSTPVHSRNICAVKPTACRKLVI